jgi:hypothetical protein
MRLAGIHGTWSEHMTQSRIWTLSLGLIVAVGGVLGLAGSLRADETAMAQEPALQGPKVEDDAAPGVKRSFGEGEGGAVRRMRLAPQALNEALEGVLRQDAPADIKATPEQAEQLKAIRADFRKQMAEYQRSQREEIAKLRREYASSSGDKPAELMDEMQDESKKAPAAGGGGRRIAAGLENLDEAGRERLRKIMDGAPKAEDVYVKAWAILTPSQRTHVEASIEQFKAEAEKREAERYVEKRLKDRREGAGQADAKAKDGSQPAGERGGVSPERRERLMRILSRMTPEQQDQLLERLEARMREGSGNEPPASERRGNRRARGEAKPAPDMADVQTPSPEEAKRD